MALLLGLHMHEQVTLSGEGDIGENDVWSAFSLRFPGSCLDETLAIYGENVAGMGPVSSV